MENQTVLITGGTSGIGYEIVKLLQQNNTLIIISKDMLKLKKLSEQFKNIKIYQADLSNTSEIEVLSNTIIKDYKTINVLINNAGVQYHPTFLDEGFDYANIAKEITINFTSVCSLTYKLLPLLLNNPKASILNVNSGLALTPKTSSAIYCATKGALNIFTQALRYQLQKSNISVHQVFLELVDTKMSKGRGKNKISPENAAKQIIYGLEHNILDHDIGKVKLLRFLLRFFPSLAKNIMKKY
ncbi:MAG: SDR family NAD(P)-dependent oxidoreductase [Campylobacteraceae bacterium]|nr:SDR family NAD(P)-dependent oxidoreductase [Campylobacteraceae bacterium]